MSLSKELEYFKRTYGPKVVIYKADGTGRDDYIQTNNGGFYQGGVKPLGILDSFEIKKFSHFYDIR